MSEKTVFISYRRDPTGKAFARTLKQELTRRGYDAFLDVDCIDSGRWAAQILTQVPRRAHFLLVLTPGCLDRCADENDWVRREYLSAVQSGRNIVPVREESVNVSALRASCHESVLTIFDLQIAEIRHGSFDNDIETLVDRYIPPHKAPVPAASPAQPTQPELMLPRLSRNDGKFLKKTNRSRWHSVVAVIATCVLGYFAWFFWIHTNTYQISAMVRQASGVVISLGDDGIFQWADALAFAGKQNDALAFARGLPKEDEKTAALAAIAVRVVQRGEPDKGYSILTEAFASARHIPENRRMERYTQLLKTARALTFSGRVDLVVRVLDTLQYSYLPIVPSGNNRSNVARSIAEEYIAAGQLDSAKKILLAALPEASKDRHNWSQVSLAVALGRVGEKEKAAEVLKSAETEAKRTESEPEWDINAAEQYMLLANAYRMLGMLEGQRIMVKAAIDAARKMKANNVHHNSYNIESVDYFEFGFNAAAFARNLARNGEVDSIEEFIRREGYPLTRVQMRVAVAEALGKADATAGERYITDAEKEVGLIEDNELRAEAFCALAESAIQSARTDRAVRFLDVALAAARGMREEYDSVNRRDFAAGKAHGLAYIALLLAEVGRSSESILVAHEAEKASKHIAGDPSFYLPRISQALANSGDISLALQTADRAIDGSDKLSAYAAVLRGLTTKNEKEAVRLMQDPEKQNAVQDEW